MKRSTRSFIAIAMLSGFIFIIIGEYCVEERKHLDHVPEIVQNYPYIQDAPNCFNQYLSAAFTTQTLSAVVL